ncbi:MAG: hypothetical protein PHW76_05615 [Alphaproteobacteria bacterium]|nr:hypothetical protein [Alphaproteobacteria bacterium]
MKVNNEAYSAEEMANPVVCLADLMDEPFVTREQAAYYLRQRYGAPCAVSATTLAKLASVGGGPTMHRFGRRVGYLKRHLDEWAQSRCSGPVRITARKAIKGPQTNAEAGERNLPTPPLRDSKGAE